MYEEILQENTDVTEEQASSQTAVEVIDLI